MKSLFDVDRVGEVKGRFALLRQDSARQWGSMNAAQTVSHCVAGIEMAAGEVRPPRALIGRLLGPLVKKMALRDDEPMRRNSPTMKELVRNEECDLEAERGKLYAAIDRLVAAGPAGCTAHPHAFFGRLSPEEWGILMYKHLDHHLRQFGV